MTKRNAINAVFSSSKIIGCALAVSLLSSGCGTVLREKPVRPDLNSSVKQPLTGEQSMEVLGTAASGWWHGQGLGETILQAGTVVAFPPYALMVLGNGALNMAGYESIGVSSFLDDESRKVWLDGFGNVTSGPGRLTASLAGKEYKTEEVLLEDYKAILQKTQKQNTTDVVALMGENASPVKQANSRSPLLSREDSSQ
jgi:hypothetical protein